MPFLQPGRLVKVNYHRSAIFALLTNLILQIKNNEDEYDWGAVINFKKILENAPGGRKGRANPALGSVKIQVDLLLHVVTDPSSQDTDVIPKPCINNQVKQRLYNLFIFYEFLNKAFYEDICK